MIEVTFIQKDTGDKEIIQVPEHTTLMEASRFYSKNWCKITLFKLQPQALDRFQKNQIHRIISATLFSK